MKVPVGAFKRRNSLTLVRQSCLVPATKVSIKIKVLCQEKAY